jgi:hypothetical protein
MHVMLPSQAAKMEGVFPGVASPFVVFERDEVSSVAGSPPLSEASETATAGPAGPAVADHRVILAKSRQRQARRTTVVEPTMDVTEWLRKQLERASPDLLRAMVQEFAEALMGAEADALCGAPYGERSPERVNIRNGYRERAWDTRVGTVELQIPKLRQGSYFPDWLLQPRRRAEQAFVSVIADAYLAGVSTRRVEKLVQQLGVERMSKSQVSRLAKSLDAIVEDFRTRPLEGAPYPYLRTVSASGWAKIERTTRSWSSAARAAGP